MNQRGFTRHTSGFKNATRERPGTYVITPPYDSVFPSLWNEVCTFAQYRWAAYLFEVLLFMTVYDMLYTCLCDWLCFLRTLGCTGERMNLAGTLFQPFLALQDWAGCPRPEQPIVRLSAKFGSLAGHFITIIISLFPCLWSGMCVTRLPQKGP